MSVLISLPSFVRPDVNAISSIERLTRRSVYSACLSIAIVFKRLSVVCAFPRDQSQDKSVVSLAADGLYSGRIEARLCRQEFKEAANALNARIGVAGINY